MTAIPRLTIKWWHWLLLVLAFLLVMVLTILLALRSMGRGDYERVIADLRAQKKIATIDEFIASAPKVDVSLQEDWHQWSERHPDYPNSSGRTFDQKKWSAYVIGQGPVPSELLTDLNDRRAEMEIARRLLERSDLVLSAFGWIAQDLPPHKRSLPDASRARTPHLLASRSLGKWLHHEACTNPDPGPALTDLDRLNTAFQRPGCLIDTLIWVAVASMRDEAYLHLALLGRLPNTHRDTWLAEPCRLLDGIASGFDGERAWFSDCWVRWVDQMGLIGSFREGRMIGTSPFTGSGTPWWDPQWLYSGPLLWSTSHHDMAIIIETEAGISARLRGEATTLPDCEAAIQRMWGYGSIGLPNLMEAAISTLEADTRHRMFRTAVRILNRVAADGLPTDRDDLLRRLGGSDLLTPTGDHLHLTYERLSTERFRLVVSPTSPVPNYDDPVRLPGRSRAFGKPASKESLVTSPHLEIQLPLRLRPATP